MEVTQQDLDALKARLGARLVEAELQAVVLERMVQEAVARAQQAEARHSRTLSLIPDEIIDQRQETGS